MRELVCYIQSVKTGKTVQGTVIRKNTKTVVVKTEDGNYCTWKIKRLIK